MACMECGNPATTSAHICHPREQETPVVTDWPHGWAEVLTDEDHEKRIEALEKELADLKRILRNA